MSSAVGATSSVCASCSKPFGLLTRSYVCPTPTVDASDASQGCGRCFCWSCINFALITASEAEKALAKNDIANAKITSFCKPCFKRASPLDYASKDPDIADGVQVFQPSQDAPKKEATVFFAHGGGGSRLMFAPHALEFAQRGYRTVIFDLPRHGSKMDDALNYDTATARVSNVVAKHGSAKNFYIGGSLGGYLGMELVGRQPSLFSACVITMCGQAVGPGSSLLAKFGLFAMGSISSNLSSSSLLSAMRGQVVANGHLNPKMVMDTSLRTGFFFEHNTEQIDMLKQSDPLSSLPKYKGPILFINGSKDHRDSEKKWLDASNRGNGDKSMLIVYEGGDHFFSHDERFYPRFIKDIETFFDSV